MGKTFYINIDCSKILTTNEAAQYTMFIDSSKMSIVYEVVEWIRWMFSVNYCIYLMHENSAIHELEDIQVLSELKNFQIIQCGMRHCVHKKIYRTLLDDLNLIVSWKDRKVHKYFLDKINQISQNLNRESTKAHNDSSNATVQNLKTFNTGTDHDKKINTVENKLHMNKGKQLEGSLAEHPVIKEMFTMDHCYRSPLGEESSSVMSTCFEKKITEKENTSPQLDDSFSLFNLSRNLGNESSETKEVSNANPNKSNSDMGPAQKEIRIDGGNIKRHSKPKPIKPFSVGEILSVIRKDLEEKNIENTSQSSGLGTEERQLDMKISGHENSFSVHDEVTGVRKRQRTRKRKRSRRQTPEGERFNSCDIEDKRSFFPLRTAKSNCDIKPHHIRFHVDNDDDDNDNIMESECIEAPRESKLEINSKEINNISASAFLKNESEELVSVSNGYEQDVLQKSMVCSSEKNDAYKMECSFASDNEVREEKVIDDPHDKVNQSSSSLENFLSNNYSHDLSDLLSLREKYKNGVVIQRF